MAGIHIQVDLAPIKAEIADIYQRQIPFVASLALNATANDVLAAEHQEMEAVFDRPTPWTLNSMRIENSNKAQGDTLTAEVDFKDFGGSGTPAYKYLQPEISGGARRYKSHELRLQRAGILHSGEFVVPGQGVSLDAFGNMSGSQIEQVLSQVGAAEQFAGYSANATKRSRARHAAQGGPVYFLLRGTRAHAGIYRREPGTRRILPFLIFVRAPMYGPRFPAYERARQVVVANFPKNFWRIWAEQQKSFRR